MKTLRELGLLARDEVLGTTLVIAVRLLILAVPIIGRQCAGEVATRLLASYTRAVRIDA